MDELNNKKEPSVEEQLDALLAQFLQEPEEKSDALAPGMEETVVDAAWLSSLFAETAAPEITVQQPAVQEASAEEAPVAEVPISEIPAAEDPAPVMDNGQLYMEDLLSPMEGIPEIGADEQAVAAAGLTRPEDAELVSIIEETKQEAWMEPEQMAIEDLPTLPVDPEEFLDAEVREAFDEGKSLDQVFGQDADTPPIQPELCKEAPAEETIPRKRRPKNQKSYGLFGIPHVLSTVIWLALVVCIGAALGRMIWVCAADVLAFGREDQAVTLTITKNDDLDSVAEKLHQTGLVEYPGLFKIYAQLTDAMDKIGTGTFELNTLYDYHALVLMMSPTASNRVTIEVRIPEGYNASQIFQLLQQKGVCTVAELEAAAANADLGDYWFLEGVERGTANCLEGYLFPDTYEFYLGDSPNRVLGKFLTNFDNRFSEEMRAMIDALNATLSAKMAANGLSQAYIDSHQLTVRDVVIIASMVEKETSSTSEGYTIASVIYNRLTNPDNYPYLNIDATLVYVLGKNQLNEEDKRFDSPYNTYLYKGLIPGPISNPGLASLNAALVPEDSGYYYYALDPKANAHHFSKTYEEHQAFLESLKKE